MGGRSGRRTARRAPAARAGVEIGRRGRVSVGSAPLPWLRSRLVAPPAQLPVNRPVPSAGATAPSPEAAPRSPRTLPCPGTVSPLSSSPHPCGRTLLPPPGAALPESRARGGAPESRQQGAPTSPTQSGWTDARDAATGEAPRQQRRLYQAAEEPLRRSSTACSSACRSRLATAVPCFVPVFVPSLRCGLQAQTSRPLAPAGCFRSPCRDVLQRPATRRPDAHHRART